MKKSVNALTQDVYDIPEVLDDSKNIEKFLIKNNGKKVIVVQGLGFVGAVMSLVCANSFEEEYAVIGIDLPNENTYWKIRSINDGVFPLTADDPKIDEFFQESIKKGNFLATYDSLVYKYADVVIVDINLDVEKISEDSGVLNDYNVDLTGFKSAIASIGKNCKEDVLILVETTVPPGTSQFIVKPAIDNELSKRGLSTEKYRLGHSYERVMPGPEYIDSIREFPRVYSGVNKISADSIEQFLKTIIDSNKCELTRLEHTNATEMAKVLENSYRAMNIAFAIEWSRFAEEAGVDLYSMVDAIRIRKTHSNLMYPGIGVGGYCLTKDPLLASWARKSFFASQSGLDMSVNSVSNNDQMPIFAFNRLVEVFGSLEGKKVAFLGVSYRGDVGDTRYTPVETLVTKVRESKSEILLHDPYVSFWQEQECYIESNIDIIFNSSPDIIIISTGHKDYKKDEILHKIIAMDSIKIFDTIGLLSEDQIFALQKKHTVSVLGRGDIN
jgi:nucleotide sugar dehydrogenase